MRFAAAALLGSAAVVAGAWGASGPAQLLEAAQVEVVAYPSGDVRICPGYGTPTDSGPAGVPACATGLEAVGVDVSALTMQAPGHPERWGLLHLVGTYDGDTFQVTSQGPPQVPPNPPDPYGAPVPCPRPHGGWRHAQPTESQRATVDHYFGRVHHHDLVSIAFFHHGTVLVVSSTHPTRTRKALGPAWPRQLCVVRARHSRHFVNRVRTKLLGLMQPSRATRYGWVSGAGGYGTSTRGQLTISLDVLIVTPTLRTFLGHQPRGLVVVDSTFRPVR